MLYLPVLLFLLLHTGSCEQSSSEGPTASRHEAYGFPHLRPTVSSFLSRNPIAFLKEAFDRHLPPVIVSFLRGNPIVNGGLGHLEGNIDSNEEFDYIVAGGGTAGNAIGVRLAEAGHRVAIVEAGSFFETSKPILSSTPAGDIIGIGADIRDSIGTVDWKFQTVPQAGANNRRFHFARGKCLGGTSALNFMIYQRGNTGSYDAWAKAVGDDTFRLPNFLKFFQKSVTFTPPNTQKRKQNSSALFAESEFPPRGEGGPVQLGYTNWVSSWATWLEQGLKAAGIQRTDGFNNGNLLGYHYTQTTIRETDATRSSSAEYVYSAKKKKLRTLKVFLDTHVLRIHFNRDKKATGVTVENSGERRQIRARREVIISAGAFQSPQLLMVSGIGPEDTLRRFDIAIISALPGVGQNMWDHIFFGPSYAVKFPTLDDILINPSSLISAVQQYILEQDGPLSSNIIEFVGWEKLPRNYRRNLSPDTERQLAATFTEDWPEVEYLAANGYLGDFSWPITQQHKDGKQYATILGAMVAPLSRGNVTIQSRSALDAPIINPNWLTAKADQEVAIAWFRRMRDVGQSLRAITIGGEKWPGKQVDSDEEVLQMIRNTLMTVWHPACTCKMGQRGDRMAVVDSQARVFGVRGLRVVDASAMPLLPPGHPQSTIYALAEKIAEDILRGDNYRGSL